MRFLNHDEVAAIAAEIGKRYRALVLVATYSGLRAGGLQGLRRRDVDLLHRTITVTQQLVESLDRHLGDDGFEQAGPYGMVATAPRANRSASRTSEGGTGDRRANGPASVSCGSTTSATHAHRSPSSQALTCWYCSECLDSLRR